MAEESTTVEQHRVAIGTGGAQGTGAATAAKLAAGGASVAVVDLTADRSASIVEKITADGGRALAVGCDVTDSAAVTSWARSTSTSTPSRPGTSPRR